jgi:hypothetical protein
LGAIISVAFNLLGFALLGLIGYRLIRYARPSGGSTIVLLAAMLSLFIGNLDRIKTLKASRSGFEAETRDVINEAKDTVVLLRKLAVVTAGLQVRMLAAEGRLQGPGSLLQKDEQKDQLLADLKTIGLNEEEVEKVGAADNAWVKWDYVIYILQPLNSNTDRAKLIAYTAAYNRFENPLSPKECDDVLNQFHASGEITNDLLDDYRYYLKYGKPRRPDVWRQRPSGLGTAPWAMDTQ